jgi:hypothetical protein
MSTIVCHQGTSPAYSIYGDESRSDEIASYGLVTFRNTDVLAAETALRQIKVRYGANPDEHLHCRKLFAKDQLRKTSYRHLAPEAIVDLYFEAIITVMGHGAQFDAGWVRKESAPKVMVVPWADPPGRTPPVVISDKHLAVFAFVSAAAPITNQLGIGNYRLWLDPDSTAIDWFGPHRQTHNLYRAFFEGQLAIQTEPIVNEKPQLLEIADLVAYAAARAFAVQRVPNQKQCVDLFNMMAPRQSEFRFHDQVFADRRSWAHLPQR